jgi:hypothetical protein
MIDSPLSVSDTSNVALILFDTVVVTLTLAGTLGTWRVYKRSAWARPSLTSLLAQQSKLCLLCMPNLICERQNQV